MNSIREVISVVSTGTKNLSIPTDTTGIKRKYDNDHLFEALPELVNEKFRGWYCGRFYRIGRKRVLELAAIAKADGSDPRRLFTKLLKQETAS